MAEDTKPADGGRDSLLAQARDLFTLCEDAENHNRTTALEDIRFARLGEQWPDSIVAQRQKDKRPCLTINKLPTYIRQVVNDARQNKPGIQIKAADSNADPETAEVFTGLVRNIEYTSNADTAYDTATECAVSGGFGYLRVITEYACNDIDKLDIKIKRVANPFAIYGDPFSQSEDSADWNVAFVTDRMSKDQFKKQYGDKSAVDWDDSAWRDVKGTWRNDEDNTVLVAEWWSREEVEKPIFELSDGSLVDEAFLQENELLIQAGVVQVVKQDVTKSYKVTQRIMTGAEILEENDWPGEYIPIIPVYGDEINVEGKRYFRSLIHNAIDAQRMFNYWRTNATELVALAPRVPFIGPKGAFDDDIDRWNTANSVSHPFLEYSGPIPPQRQPLDMGAAAGSLQEALNANDDIKAALGMFDASLGARSNETSGRAIMARQREGDVSTFHFIDNMARAIRHLGRILIDLIPKVYTDERMVRILGEDGEQSQAMIGPEMRPEVDPNTGQPIPGPDGKPRIAVHSLTAGKYDLTVKTGPSYTTRREEAAVQMTEVMRAFPASAPIVAPELAKNLDWPGADKLAEKFEAMASGQVPEQAQQQMAQMQKQLQDMSAQMQKLAEENQKLKADKSEKFAELEADREIQLLKVQSEREIAEAKLQSQNNIEFYKAQAQAAAAAQRVNQQPRGLTNPGA